MSIELIMIPLAFLIICSLLLWFVIGSKGNWIVKLVSTILCSLLCFGIWYSMSAITGWSSEQKPTAKFEIRWVIVKEPSKSNIYDEGAIHLWTIPLTSEDPLAWMTGEEKRLKELQPRSYVIPYTKENHKAAQGMQQKLRKGERVYGGVGKQEKGQGQNGPKGDGSGTNPNGGGHSQSDDKFDLYELPPPIFPPKEFSGKINDKNKMKVDDFTPEDLRGGGQQVF